MKKLIIAMFSFLMVLSIQEVSAVNYTNAFGVRFGPSKGFSYKVKSSDISTVETLLHSQYNGYKLTLIHSYQKDIKKVEGLAYYMGMGAHLGFSRNDTRENLFKSDNRTKTNYGFDGIVGIEYIYPNSPIGISIDYKPSFNIKSKLPDDSKVGLSLRWYFGVE
jgi:hypothetical protein